MDKSVIEEMNRVRASLGLAPLPVPSGDSSGPQFQPKEDASDSDDGEDLSTLDKRQAAAGSNWQRLDAERADKLERQKRKDAAKKARDAAQRFSKLEGKGLGDADETDDLGTRAWLLQQKKRQKQIEKSRKLQEEREAREQQAEYTSKDLAGVKVGHHVDDFDEITGEQILTLKDAEIGDISEDDELENADLKAKDKLDERLQLKKKKPDYDPTEQGEQQNILSKYDEEIDGKKRKQFALDGSGTSAEAAKKQANNHTEAKRKGIIIDLDMFKDDTPISDYVDPSTIKVKKPKKKKEKKVRQRATDDDGFDTTVRASMPSANAHTYADAMDVDGVATDGLGASKKRAIELDDDDLQANLAESRRQALKKRKKIDAAEVARQLREEMQVDEVEVEAGGMVIDETSEFVKNLKRPEAEDDEEEDARKLQAPPSLAANLQNPEGNNLDNEFDMAETVNENEEVDEVKSESRIEPGTSGPADLTATGLEDEDVAVDHGIGKFVEMLRKRGFTSDNGSEATVERDRQRSKFLAEKQDVIDRYDAKAKAQREADRRSGRFDKMTNRERDEYARKQNEQREKYIAGILAEKFNKSYRPNVQLNYHDEFGREMNQKEAFKHLSHAFHGKGSGKQKTEKRLKKIEDEKKNMAKGMLNIGEEGGMMNVQGREGKRQKTAGVRLQ